MDNGCISGTVFIDLEKVFDTGGDVILCPKLKHYGLQQNELLWFNSYLFNSKQYCRDRGFDSHTSNIDVGVPS